MQWLATRARRFPVRDGRTLALLLVACLIGVPARAADWQVEVTPDGELFPALDLSQAARTTREAMGDGNGLLAVRVVGGAGEAPLPLRLRIDTPGLRAPATIDLTATTFVWHPRLDWDRAQLRALSEPRRQLLRVTLQRGGAPAQVRSVEVRLHPLDDALYFVRDGRDRVDLGWAFAGYVDPRSRVVDEVIAIANSLDSGFDAPLRSDADARRKVGAVWAALEQHGVRYADGDPSLSRGPLMYSQRVRLLDQVWRDRRANCLDGSVLIASVLERLGIGSVIALVPGHAFVGFRLADRRRVVYLETTLLGAALPTAKADTGTRRAQASARRYAAAQAAGRARWRATGAKLDGRHGPDYALIDIATARALGVIPIGNDGEIGVAQPGAGAAAARPFDSRAPPRHNGGPYP